LLGGLNAGSLYPLTVIFAFVPPIAAWIIKLRRYLPNRRDRHVRAAAVARVRTLSSFAAAMTSPTPVRLVGQLVHLGVVQGFASSRGRR